MSVIEQDTFIRANQSGFGTASNGDTWATNIGSPTLAISSNEGTITGITAQTLLQLGSTTTADTEVLVRCSASASTSNRMGVALRISTNNGYIGRLSAAGNNLVIGKIVSGTETDLSTATFTVSTSTFYWVRYRVVGSSHFLKAWADGSAEPAAWNINAFSDSTFTSAGGVGITANATASGTTASFNAFFAVDYPLQDTNTLSDSFAPTVSGLNTDSVTNTEVNAQSLALVNPVLVQFALDNFTRANQSGWGTATDGTTWSQARGTATLAISSNTGTATLPGTASDTYSVLDSEITNGAETVNATFQVTNVNNSKIGVILRWQDSSNFYYAFADFNAQNMHISKFVANVFSTMGNASITFSSATNYNLRFRAVGSNLYAKFWQDGTTPPSTWNIVVNDTSITNPGKVGIFTSPSNGSVITVDNFFANEYLVSDNLTLTEVNLDTVIALNTDSLTTSETNADTVNFLPTDQLTSVEVDAITLANTITDTLTLLDATTTKVAVSVIDTLTQVETFLNTIAGIFTDASNLAEVTSTNISLATSDSLSTSDSITGMSFFLAQLTDITLTILESFLATEQFIPVEQLSGSESYAIVIASAFTDILILATIILTNTYLTDIALNAVDNFNNTLSLTDSYQLSLSDTLNFAQATFVTFTESLTITETYLFSLGLLEFTNTVPLELLLAIVSLAQTDNSSTSDSMFYSLQWLLSDTLNTIDAIAETLLFTPTEQNSTTELQSLTLSYAVVESSSLTDTSTTMPVFKPTDSLAPSDSGSQSLTYATTESLSILELTAISGAFIVLETLTSTELATYALSSLALDQIGINEVIALSLSFVLSESLSEQESFTGVVRVLSIDTVSIIDTSAYTLATSIVEQVATSDVLFTIINALSTDSLSSFDTLSGLLATSFTGWTDILSVIDASTTTGIALNTDSMSLTEQSVYTVRISPIDQLTSIESISEILALSIQEGVQVTDASTSTIIGFTTDSINEDETVVWTLNPSFSTDILTASETVSYSLLFAILELLTTTEAFSVQLSTPFIDSVSNTETVAWNGLFVPVEGVSVQEAAIYALAMALQDTILQITEVGPVLTLALLDIPLSILDTISYVNAIYLVSYLTVRAGTVSLNTNIGVSLQ